jgi:hypothetical protein
VAASSLAPGEHVITLSVTSGGRTGTTSVKIFVYRSFAAMPPALVAEPAMMAFSVWANTGLTEDQIVRVSTTGSLTTTWTAVASAPWLQVRPDPNVPGHLVRLDTTNLPPGLRTATVMFTPSNSLVAPDVVTVEVEIFANGLSSVFLPATGKGAAP